MNRRDFLKATGYSAIAGTALKARGASTKKRNIILYVMDDLGMDDTGCYGNPVIQTPGMDMLAASGGTMFSHAFCTTPSCSASRSVILTGLHNHANGQYGHQHSYSHFSSMPHIRSMPNLLNEKGYRTASAGKYHVAPEELYHFQNYIKGPSPSEMAESCRDLIAADSDRPFFLYFCTNEPHRSFKREGSDPVSPDEVIVPSYLPDTPECRGELARYYMSAQRADSGLDRLIRILKETGHWDDTLIIATSDNGIAFPGAKTCLYEPGIRLPFIVRNPFQSNQANVCDALINWADITPTILYFAAAAPNDYAFHGRSFLSVLQQEHPPGWDKTFASHTFHEITMYYPMRVVRTRRYKLLWNIAHGLEFPFASDLWDSETWQGILKSGAKVYGKRSVDAYLNRPKFELYDLQKDPHEINNLADDPEHTEILKNLQNELKAFQKETNDPWDVKWKHE